MTSNIRTSFSVLPSDELTILDVYSALLNFIWAKQHSGKFYIFIANFGCLDQLSATCLQVLKELAWFGISCTNRNNCQSDRFDIYKDKLEALIIGNKVYRCFCLQNDEITSIADSNGYNRMCLGLSSEKIKAKLAAGNNFVWKLKEEFPVLPQVAIGSKKLTYTPLTFRDFALTTPQGKFTRVFMDFVDDWQNLITHKFLQSIYVDQAKQQTMLYNVFMIAIPKFYIVPQVVNGLGYSLSTSDSGFFVRDLIKLNKNPNSILSKLLGFDVENIETAVKVFNFKQLNNYSNIVFSI